MQETIVMSVGGSLIVPDGIDTTFLSSLKKLIESETVSGDRRFIIIAGGGKTSRRYVDAATTVSELDHDDMDWLGIHATRLNGHLLRTIFKDIAHPVMITNPDEVLDISKTTKVIIAAGYRPGSSSDLQAVRIADRVSAKKLINLSNIDYVYTADPRTNPDAQKIEKITWGEFRKLIPKEWGPNLSSPFDPIAAKNAEEKGIEVANINGAHLEDLDNYLDGKPFIGTRIHS
jgi:uridylate kinase